MKYRKKKPTETNKQIKNKKQPKVKEIKRQTKIDYQKIM